MADLFLEGMFDSDSASPSRVQIIMPNAGDNAELSSINMIGLMIGEPNFSAGNKWGTIINDLSNLADFSSMVGSSSMWSWIGASTMCWKGTAPLSVGIDFYLINYSKKLNLEKQLKILVKFAALAQTGSDDLATVSVHGGYAADVLDSNSGFFNKDLSIQDMKGLKSGSGSSKLKDLNNGKMYSGGQAKGSLQLQFGNKLVIRNLLLSKINVSTSNVEVAAQDGKSNIKPLYYRVNAQFTGVRPLLTTDVDYMFNLG